MAIPRGILALYAKIPSIVRAKACYAGFLCILILGKGNKFPFSRVVFIYFFAYTKTEYRNNQIPMEYTQ